MAMSTITNVKKELLQIRCGISMISQICDANKELNKSISAQDRLLKEKSNEMLNIKDQILETTRKYKDLEDEILRIHESSTKEIHRTKRNSLYLVLSIVTLVGMALYSVLFGAKYQNDNQFLELFMKGGIPLIALIALLFFVALYFRSKKDVVKYFTVEDENVKAQLRVNEDQIQNYKNELAELERELEKKKQEYQSYEKDVLAVTEKYQDSLKENNDTANDIYNMLINNFGDTLNPSEWKNVDLLYYYISINRAETIRDSLKVLNLKKLQESFIDDVGDSKERMHKDIVTLDTQDEVDEGNIFEIQLKNLNASLKDNEGNVKRVTLDMNSFNKSLLFKSYKTMKEMLDEYLIVNNRKIY